MLREGNVSHVHIVGMHLPTNQGDTVAVMSLVRVIIGSCFMLFVNVKRRRYS